MDSTFLFNTFIFLASACLVVPLTSRFKLGSVLGYLAAGILIGPFGFGFIGNAEQIMHYAEFGVVMMLFLIGLELEPETLWRLRKSILGLGGLQVCATTAAFAGLGVTLGYDWRASLAAGMALALSSTALVLQMLDERGYMHTEFGESSFAVLLFQDVAVIPILILMPLLSLHTAAVPGQPEAALVADMSGIAHALTVAASIGCVVVAGRFFSRRMFYFIAKTNLREVFTATSLALVVGITLLMQLVGISPALGAFIAGLVLANSEYKHTLESDIEPFKSLLLGLFFISVGMGMDFGLLAQQPLRLCAVVAALMTVKGLILLALGRKFGLEGAQNAGLALALCQGGEFAFVLFQFAGGLHIIGGDQAALLTLAVALSMALSPLLMMYYQKRVVPCYMSALPDPDFDTITENGNPVILAGYGRFGQIIGRFLSAQGVKVTILEKDPDQIELLRKFGFRGYFGDASRRDLLKSAGADRAKLLIVAVDDADDCLSIVRMAKRAFPNLAIYARARNRRHAYELYKAGVDYYRRETFDSSLTMAQRVMVFLGRDDADMRRKAAQFTQHDEATLVRSFEFYEKEPELINFSRQASGELERILSDKPEEDQPEQRTGT